MIHVLGTNYYIARSPSFTLLEFESAVHICDSWCKTHCIAFGCRQSHLSLQKANNHFLESLDLIVWAVFALTFQNFNLWVWVFACMCHSSPNSYWYPRGQKEGVRSCGTECIKVFKPFFGFWELNLSLL